MSSILKSIRLAREASPVAFVVLPLSAFVFITTLFGYVALTIVS